MNKIKIISCAVLSHDLNGRAAALGLDVDAEYLEAGLHEKPRELKKTLQEAVDRASADGRYERIVIGYGLCGLGTVGLKAGAVPLVIPRVHDCIALFMGSEKHYREQFSRHPGTLYMSRGWYENKTQPQGIRKKRSDHDGWGLYEGYDVLKRRYGEDNAREVYDFLNSWQKNYTRSVYINSGGGEENPLYEDYARDLAEELNLGYERIDGSGEIFLQMLTESSTTDEILFVPPRFRTGYDPLNKGLYAYREEERDGEMIWNRPEPSSGAAEKTIRQGLGLGIDAGGTYTDAVIYDYENDKVLAKGKSPTTKRDYSLGILNAVDTLPADLVGRVDLTVVSTTLATNAIVENRGRKVGLILMPLGKERGDNLPSPWRQVRGKLSIQGEEREPVDEEEVRRTIRELVNEERVESFAVSGYGSTANPAHENRIKEIITEETGMGVCCGHELSSSLNFYVRANTAVLNGGIVPLLESFIDDLEKALAAKGIGGNIMIVKGDGSLMSRSAAKAYPVETALSGPAASITGARYMVNREDLLVIDVGGTTSDIGLVSRGNAVLTGEGARVGNWRTHVKAVDMSTLGTGGDSRILIEQRVLTVGPRRVVPISRLSLEEGWEEAFAYMETLPDPFFRSTAAMEVLALTGRASEQTLTEDEQRILGFLEERPNSLRELALKLGHGLWYLVDTENLEKQVLVQRFGLTPTDLLIASGEISLWDRTTAEKGKGLYEKIWGREEGILERDVFLRIHENIMETLIRKELSLEEGEGGVLLPRLLERLKGEASVLSLKALIDKPLVGVGAAAPWLLRGTAEKLGAELILPPDGDVANAVGAVCSMVTVRRQGEIQPAEEGTFVALGGRTAQFFDDFDQACLWLESELALQVREDAHWAGTGENSVQWETENRISETGEGTAVFLGRRYSARITGLPA